MSKKDKFTMRVEKHIVKTANLNFKMLDEYCFLSKNLYNFANYHLRQEFCKTGKYLSYGKMDKLMKQADKDFDYRNMPTAQSAQQTLRQLNENWKSFFKAIKDWSKYKEKYTGMPKLPKYLKKNGRFMLILTNQNCKVEDGYIKFPKCFNGFTVKTKVSNLQQVRILPRNKHIIVEVVYKADSIKPKQDNKKYIGIDMGVENFATMGSNTNGIPLTISGEKLKSINKYYNKEMAHYRAVAKRMNGLDYTNKMNKLTMKRNNMITDLIHKASKNVIEYALSCEVNTIVIGNSKDWKRESGMSKNVNQSFVGIPHQKFIDQILYKAEDAGLNVMVIEESYTSGTSFLDGEKPVKKDYDKSRRIKRGLFKSNNGKLINADLNAAYQIIKKVFPKAFVDGIEDVGLHPVRVGI